MGLENPLGIKVLSQGVRKNLEAFVALADSTLKKKIKASKRGLLISVYLFQFPLLSFFLVLRSQVR